MLIIVVAPLSHPDIHSFIPLSPILYILINMYIFYRRSADFIWLKFSCHFILFWCFFLDFFFFYVCMANFLNEVELNYPQCTHEGLVTAQWQRKGKLLFINYQTQICRFVGAAYVIRDPHSILIPSPTSSFNLLSCTVALFSHRTRVFVD